MRGAGKRTFQGRKYLLMQERLPGKSGGPIEVLGYSSKFYAINKYQMCIEPAHFPYQIQQEVSLTPAYRCGKQLNVRHRSTVRPAPG
jgi:hypothetical protein